MKISLPLLLTTSPCLPRSFRGHLGLVLYRPGLIKLSLIHVLDPVMICQKKKKLKMGIFTIHMGGVLGRRKYFNEISREKYMAYAIFFLFSLSSSKSYFSDILCSVLCSNRHVFFSLKAFLCISLFFTQNLPKCSLSYQFPVLTTCQGSGL